MNKKGIKLPDMTGLDPDQQAEVKALKRQLLDHAPSTFALVLIGFAKLPTALAFEQPEDVAAIDRLLADPTSRVVFVGVYRRPVVKEKEGVVTPTGIKKLNVFFKNLIEDILFCTPVEKVKHSRYAWKKLGGQDKSHYPARETLIPSFKGGFKMSEDL